MLKPGGRALIIDLRGDVTPAAIKNAVDQMGLSPINRMITRLTFRFMLVKRAYTKEAFEEMIARSRFQRADIQDDSLGLDIWLEK